MSSIHTVEDRLATLEREFAQLKQRLEAHSIGNWLDEVSGRMKNIPEFEDVVRLGREFREAQTDSGE